MISIERYTQRHICHFTRIKMGPKFVFRVLKSENHKCQSLSNHRQKKFFAHRKCIFFYASRWCHFVHRVGWSLRKWIRLLFMVVAGKCQAVARDGFLVINFSLGPVKIGLESTWGMVGYKERICISIKCYARSIWSFNARLMH